jgi:hypothetical protein
MMLRTPYLSSARSFGSCGGCARAELQGAVAKAERCKPKGEIERARRSERGADLRFEAKASELRESYMSDVPRIHSEAAEQAR